MAAPDRVAAGRAGALQCGWLARQDNPYFDRAGPAFEMTLPCAEGRSCAEEVGPLADGGTFAYATCR